MSKHLEGGRKEFFGMKASEGELNLLKRCANHAGCSPADLIRWLTIEYAHVNGLPVRQNMPEPISAADMCAKLGLPPPGPVPYLMVDQATIAAQIDPDRFDDSNTSTMEPLPANESFDPSVVR